VAAFIFFAAATVARLVTPYLRHPVATLTPEPGETPLHVAQFNSSAASRLRSQLQSVKEAKVR
jgi:hypothetical protein